MKRILLSLALIALVASSCSPVKIFMDSTSPEGVRRIVTSKEKLCKSGSGQIDVSLGIKLEGEDTVAAVILICDANTGHGIFDRGNEMKFRLSDNSEITLVNLLDKKFDTHQETHTTETIEHSYGVAYAYGARRCFVRPYEVNYLVPETYTTNVSNSYALYLITRQQMTDIIQKGVIKMRIEIEDRDIDLEGSDAGSVSAILKEQILCIRERVTNPVERKEF